MALDTFGWQPSKNVRKSVKPRVREVRFGDGYRQRVPDGLNTVLSAWSVTFAARSAAEADAIEAFLATKGGAIAFLFAISGTPVSVTCSEWERTTERHNNHTITATFQQEADPV